MLRKNGLELFNAVFVFAEDNDAVFGVKIVKNIRGGAVCCTDIFIDVTERNSRFDFVDITRKAGF